MSDEKEKSGDDYGADSILKRKHARRCEGRAHAERRDHARGAHLEHDRLDIGAEPGVAAHEAVPEDFRDVEWRHREASRGEAPGHDAEQHGERQRHLDGRACPARQPHGANASPNDAVGWIARRSPAPAAEYPGRAPASCAKRSPRSNASNDRMRRLSRSAARQARK